jgi:hypothetical protein
MKTTIKSSAFLGIALFAFLSIATVAKANDDQKEKSAIEFKYLGKRDNQSLFQLQMNVPQGEEFIVRFRDKEGYVLYSTLVKKDVNQKYAIDTDEVDNTVTVEVRSTKTKKVETFTITRNQTLLDETVVAKS